MLPLTGCYVYHYVYKYHWLTTVFESHNVNTQKPLPCRMFVPHLLAINGLWFTHPENRMFTNICFRVFPNPPTFEVQVVCHKKCNSEPLGTLHVEFAIISIHVVACTSYLYFSWFWPVFFTCGFSVFFGLLLYLGPYPNV